MSTNPQPTRAHIYYASARILSILLLIFNLIASCSNASASCEANDTSCYPLRSLLFTDELGDSQPPRTYFVNVPTGNLGGINGADAVCGANIPSALSETKTYKAFLVDVANNRRASVTPLAGDGQIDWVLKANTMYHREDGTLIAVTGANGLFPFPLAVAPDSAMGSYWTGINSDWTTEIPNGACTNWTSSTGGGMTGNKGSMDDQILTSAAFSCAIAMSIWCIEQ